MFDVHGTLSSAFILAEITLPLHKATVSLTCFMNGLYTSVKTMNNCHMGTSHIEMYKKPALP